MYELCILCRYVDDVIVLLMKCLHSFIYLSKCHTKLSGTFLFTFRLHLCDSRFRVQHSDYILVCSSGFPPWANVLKPEMFCKSVHNTMIYILYMYFATWFCNCLHQNLVLLEKRKQIFKTFCVCVYTYVDVLQILWGGGPFLFYFSKPFTTKLGIVVY